MAEWLRRLTRNQMGSSRVGSNPTRSVRWFYLSLFSGPLIWNGHCTQNWPRWGSNPQSSDSKSDALSIGPRGRCYSLDILFLNITQNLSLMLMAKSKIVCNVCLDSMSSLIHCSGWALLMSTIWTFRSNFLQNERTNVSAAMAEWLRRLTRNQMGSSRVGSNPTRSGAFFRVPM